MKSFLLLALVTACNFHSTFAETSAPLTNSGDAPSSGDITLPPDTGTATSTPSPTAPIYDDFGLGPIYYDLSGAKGLILCFHGRTGSADGWRNHSQKNSFLLAMNAKGYSFICPSSLDRATGSWDSTIGSENIDIVNIDKILTYLAIPAATKIYLVGHSQGTSMVSRYPAFGARRAKVAAAQFSNAIGSVAALRQGNFVTPAIFNYSECDPIVNPATVLAGIDVLQSRNVTIEVNQLSSVYQTEIANGQTASCHDFLDTSADTSNFFARF